MGDLITVHVDASQALTYLQRLSDQTPFATSLALNRVGNLGQSAVREHIPRAFTLRRAAFVLNTVKIERADRATKTKLDVTVRIDPTRDILAKFEAGGLKTPRDGRHVAIPTANVRRSKSEVVQRSQRPRALMASGAGKRGRVFATDKGIFRRMGKAAGGLVRILYLFRTSVRIKPALRFTDTVTETVNRTWPAEMTKAFSEAEHTARR